MAGCLVDFALLLFLVKMCPKYCRNMNAMWSEMSVGAREEYKEYFIRYHNTVAKTGFTGKRVKPVTVLPPSVVGGFEKALLTKVLPLAQLNSVCF